MVVVADRDVWRLSLELDMNGLRIKKKNLSNNVFLYCIITRATCPHYYVINTSYLTKSTYVFTPYMSQHIKVM